MVDKFNEITNKAIKRWRAKGYSQAQIDGLLARKGGYKEPRKAAYVAANDDPTFGVRSEVDNIQIELERKRSLKEVWDE